MIMYLYFYSKVDSRIIELAEKLSEHGDISNTCSFYFILVIFISVYFVCFIYING